MTESATEAGAADKGAPVSWGACCAQIWRNFGALPSDVQRLTATLNETKLLILLNNLSTRRHADRQCYHRPARSHGRQAPIFIEDIFSYLDLMTLLSLALKVPMKALFPKFNLNKKPADTTKLIDDMVNGVAQLDPRKQRVASLVLRTLRENFVADSNVRNEKLES